MLTDRTIDVSIIIVSTNECEEVRCCLTSIARSQTRYAIETIVVDNACTDGTNAMARREFPQTLVVRNDR